MVTPSIVVVIGGRTSVRRAVKVDACDWTTLVELLYTHLTQTTHILLDLDYPPAPPLSCLSAPFPLRPRLSPSLNPTV